MYTQCYHELSTAIFKHNSPPPISLHYDNDPPSPTLPSPPLPSLIHLRPPQNENFDTHSFILYSYRTCKCLWRACVEHHTFFRLSSPPSSQKSSLFSISASRFALVIHIPCIRWVDYYYSNNNNNLLNIYIYIY